MLFFTSYHYFIYSNYFMMIMDQNNNYLNRDLRFDLEASM